MHKPLLFIVLLGTITISAAAQSNALHFGYQGTVPQGLMKHGWTSGHGIHFGYSRALKSVPELSFGGTMSYGLYASKRQPQQYVFSDGSTTFTHVNLSSSIATFAGTTRYTFFPDRKVTPFAELQAGYFGMFSDLYIEDPTDPLGCRALEASNVVSGGTLYGSVGTGFTFNLGRPGTGQRHQLQVGVWSGRGGNIEYANMSKLVHRDHAFPTAAGTNELNVRGNPRPLMATFVNVTNNNTLHQHSIAEVYNHKLRMLQVQVSYTWWFKRLNFNH